MSRYHIATLGCRANAADSVALAARLRARGHTASENADDADTVIINTCSVTAGADADARQLVRRVQRLNPDVKIVVTGCLAERDPEQVREWQGVEHVVGNGLKLRIPEILDGTFDGSDQTGLWEMPDVYPLFGEGGYTRAFVKVQDGCDARCSFCVIPKTRGHGRSLRPEQVVAQIAQLAKQQVREVVLSGIHLGRYGRDLTPKSSLVDLLRSILKLETPERIRVTSIEPREISDELVELLTDSERLSPHVHVPLQSGSDRILGLMRRPYTASFYAGVIEKLAKQGEDVCLGADVMVGFPGETDSDFEATLKLIQGLPISYLHVFRYSERPGTVAASMPEPVPSKLVRERSATLRALSEQKNSAWRSGLSGRTVQALTLTEKHGGTQALSENYIKLELPPRIGLNRLVSARLGAVTGRTSQATLVEV